VDAIAAVVGKMVEPEHERRQRLVDEVEEEIASTMPIRCVGALGSASGRDLRHLLYRQRRALLTLIVNERRSAPLLLEGRITLVKWLFFETQSDALKSIIAQS